MIAINNIWIYISSLSKPSIIRVHFSKNHKIYKNLQSVQASWMDPTMNLHDSDLLPATWTTSRLETAGWTSMRPTLETFFPRNTRHFPTYMLHTSNRSRCRRPLHTLLGCGLHHLHAFHGIHLLGVQRFHGHLGVIFTNLASATTAASSTASSTATTSATTTWFLRFIFSFKWSLIPRFKHGSCLLSWCQRLLILLWLHRSISTLSWLLNGQRWVSHLGFGT